MTSERWEIAIRDAMVPVQPGQSFFGNLQALGLRSFEAQVQPDGSFPNIKEADGSAPFSLDEPDALRARLAGEGAQICTLLLGTDFSGAGAERHIAWAVQAVRAAQQLGVPVIRLDPLTRETATAPETIRDNVIRAVNEVLRQTEGIPVDLALENHGSVANDPAFLDAIFAAVKDDRLGLTLDTGNFYWSGLPLSQLYEVIGHFAPRARHTHIKSIGYPAEMRGQQRPVGYEYMRYAAPVNKGDIDMLHVTDMLRKAGYQRPLCIENEMVPPLSLPEQLDTLRGEVDFLRSLS